MGAILSCVGGSRLPEVAMNLDSPQACDDSENEIVQKFIDEIFKFEEENQLRQKFKQYKDKSALIAQSFANPSDESIRSQAIAEVTPNVLLCQQLMDFGEKLGSKVKELVQYILNKVQENQTIPVLERHALICKQIAKAIDLALELDSIKLTLFKISGDISFYRRCEKDQVNSRTGVLGMFFGQPAPFMMKLQEPYASESNKAQIINFFGSLCDIFTSLMVNTLPENQETKVLLVHAIGGILITYDSLNAPIGAFAQNSGFANVDASNVVGTFEPKQNGVIAAIVYNSQTFSKPTTIPQISQVLKV